MDGYGLLTVRRQDSGGDTMSEERTQYTVHPDVLVRLETSEKHIAQLESTNDGLTMVMGRHRETMREQAERIAELEKQLEWQVAVANAFMERHELAIKDNMRQSETIARLEADNRRLRHLDAMPVDAMHIICGVVPEREDVKQAWYECVEWLNIVDGDA